MATICVATTGSDSTGDGSSGNPYATPGKALSVHSAGDLIKVATGAYTINSASTNVAGGCLSLTAGTSTLTTRLIGTDASFVALTGAPSQANNPVFTASGISTFTLVTLAGNCDAENITIDGANLTSSRGFSITNGCRLFNSRAQNCKNSGVVGAGTNLAIWCYVTGCSTAGASFTGVNAEGCVAVANTVPGFQNGSVNGCISAGNTGSTTDGFQQAVSPARRSIAYANGRHGFSWSAGTGTPSIGIDLYSEGHTAVGACGFTATAAFDNVFLHNCGGYNNTSNIGANITAGNSINFKTLSASGLISPGTSAGSNFGLNATASAGALLRAAGLLAGGFPFFTGTIGYGDIGAAQHADTPGLTGYPMVTRPTLQLNY